GDWILIHFVGGDDVDGNAFVFGDRRDVVGSHHAGVVGAVGEHDDDLAAGHLRGVAEGQQQTVVKGRSVAGDRFAQPEDGIAALLGQRSGARQVPAVGVDRHGIGAVQAANEIGDGVRGVDKAAIHIIAGVEQYKNVGA